MAPYSEDVGPKSLPSRISLYLCIYTPLLFFSILSNNLVTVRPTNLIYLRTQL